MVKHHPTSDLLAAYSAGSLPLSYALCISAHTEHCSDCMTNVQRLKNLGADLFSHLTPAPADDELKDRVFAQLKTTEQAPLAKLDSIQNNSLVTSTGSSPEKPPAVPSDSPVPRCIQKFVGADYDALSWHRVAPSIKSATLCRDGDHTLVSMLQLMPGAKVGHHSHMGEEITLVLEGSFSDEDGIYQKGDFILRNSAHKHNPVASKAGRCICLTVQDAPIQFTGLIGQLLNPLLRRYYS